MGTFRIESRAKSMFRSRRSLMLIREESATSEIITVGVYHRDGGKFVAICCGSSKGYLGDALSYVSDQRLVMQKKFDRKLSFAAPATNSI